MQNTPLRVVHLEDDAAHAELIQKTLAKAGLACAFEIIGSRADYEAALARAKPDLILSDNHVHEFEGFEALKVAHARFPQVPFVFVSSSFERRATELLKSAGAAACVLKSELEGLPRVLREVLADKSEFGTAPAHLAHLLAHLDYKRLFETAPDLFLVLLPDAPRYTMLAASNGYLEATQLAREKLVGRPLFEVFPDNPDDPAADGTAKLRASLERVLAGRRVDTMAIQKYDIRKPDGSFVLKYWSPVNTPVLSDNGEILYILHRVEDVTEVVRAGEEGEELRDHNRAMEREIVVRSRELAEANRELESFSMSVSHDLRGPLRSISGFSALLHEEYADKLDDTGRKYLNYVSHSAKRMAELIEDLISLARVARAPLKRETVDLSALAAKIMEDLQSRDPGRRCELQIATGLSAQADKRLATIALENLLGNAWKFSAKRELAHIAVGIAEEDGLPAFYVRDDGAGFDTEHSKHLFAPFQRMHAETEFAGSGIGLATVKRIINRHGGRIWVEADKDKGATFFFTLDDEI